MKRREKFRDKKLLVFDLGLSAYRPVWEFQQKLASQRLEGRIPDALIFVEHKPVYTLGKNARPEHIIASEEFLKAQGIEVVRIDRGGDVTYHGPGQLVGYPILNLNEHKRSISWYIHTLEEALIRTISDYGLSPQRIDRLTGVWIGSEKVAAIGVRISRWITMHGFALNVHTDLTHFGGIIPCGIEDKGVASLHKYIPGIGMKDVKARFLARFTELFGFDNIQISSRNDYMEEYCADEKY